mmetsp:Transcript_15290/g.52254  ORF Transcript_15290/g.52254 Transcript_15290/m.52254 type:complete len:209 (-) Transcript_15290:2504-3130(-)
MLRRLRQQRQRWARLAWKLERACTRGGASSKAPCRSSYLPRRRSQRSSSQCRRRRPQRPLSTRVTASSASRRMTSTLGTGSSLCRQRRRPLAPHEKSLGSSSSPASARPQRSHPPTPTRWPPRWRARHVVRLAPTAAPQPRMPPRRWPSPRRAPHGRRTGAHMQMTASSPPRPQGWRRSSRPHRSWQPIQSQSRHLVGLEQKIRCKLN